MDALWMLFLFFVFIFISLFFEPCLKNNKKNHYLTIDPFKVVIELKIIKYFNFINNIFNSWELFHLQFLQLIFVSQAIRLAQYPLIYTNKKGSLDIVDYCSHRRSR